MSEQRFSAQPAWHVPLLVLLISAAVLAVVSHLAVAVGSVMHCGRTVTPKHLWSAPAFVVTGDGRAAGVPARCVDDTRVTAIVIIAAVVLLIIVVGLVIVRRVMRWRESEARFKKVLRLRDGIAKRGEVRQHLSAKARLAKAGTVRPTLQQPTVKDVGVKIGESHGVPVYLSTEDSVVVEGAPRSGKGFRILISAILDWQGPLITTSTRNDNLSVTMHMRAKMGKVTVFDPQGLSGVERSMRINPITGCEDPLVAMQRAQAIMGGTALGSSTTNSEWAAEAETILSRLLLAAARGGKDVTALRDWGSAPSMARGAVAVLENDGEQGWADSLKAVLDGDPKLMQSRWMGVSAALAPLQLPQVAASMMPTATDRAFDVDEFLSGPNTLYLIGTRSGAGAAGGFLGAVLDDIVEQARRKALRSPGSRLDPPLGLILDELANLFSWKALPTVLSDGGGIGIWTLVVLQALSQAETAWSKAEAETIWSSSIAKILLGGASNIEHLRQIEGMLGTRKAEQSSRSRSWGEEASITESFERLPVISADELRRLPEGMGLLAYKNRRGVILDMPGWIDRPDADQIKAAKQMFEQMQAATFGSRP